MGWVKEVRYWVGLVERQGEGKLDIQLAELVDATWFSWEEALETMTFKKGKELLRKVIEMLDGEDKEKTRENKAGSSRL
jgi:NADH pyrophosphatase NudC (nudix superfamily)